jgi:predicted O-methyltransferase YrrM
MFNDIPEQIQSRMKYLEAIDTNDRIDGTPKLQRLRQIPEETGKFIALLLASSPQGTALEIGTSAGYSTLWLALACRESNRNITTFEILEEKADIAKETFHDSSVEDVVQLIVGDARDHIQHYADIAFCFLDAEKDVYSDCYEQVIPNMVKGGVLVADNAINHKETLQPFIDRALTDERVDAMVVPIGKGELVCRKR